MNKYQEAFNRIAEFVETENDCAGIFFKYDDETYEAIDIIQELIEKATYKTGVTTEVKDTDTIGKHTYVVALCCGGLMEDPYFYYHDYQIIRANSEIEAEEKYNELNNCSYFYGSVMGQID